MVCELHSLDSLGKPELPLCFSGNDRIPPVAAAATLFCIPSRAKEPDAPGNAFAGTGLLIVALNRGYLSSAQCLSARSRAVV
jgi:hypothetical protein